MEIKKSKLHAYSLLEESFLSLNRGSCEHNNVLMLWIMEDLSDFYLFLLLLLSRFVLVL